MPAGRADELRDEQTLRDLETYMKKHGYDNSQIQGQIDRLSRADLRLYPRDVAGDLVVESGLRPGSISIEADVNDCEGPSVPGSPTSRWAPSEEAEVVGDYRPTSPAHPT